MVEVLSLSGVQKAYGLASAMIRDVSLIGMPSECPSQD